MGCPICGGTIGYCWGSDHACQLCEKEFAAEENLPEGLNGIEDWGEARNARKATLKEGKTREQAEEIFQEILQRQIRFWQRFNGVQRTAAAGDRSPEEIAQLLS